MRKTMRARKQKAAEERAAAERAAAERVDDGGETGFSVVGEQHEGRDEAEGDVDLHNVLEERVEVDESEGSDEKLGMEWEESVDESSVDESNDDGEELENEVEEVGDSADDISVENESHINQPLLKK